MAQDTIIRVGCTVLDGNSVKAAITAYLYVDSGQTVAQVAATVATWVADVDACIEGQIIGSHFQAVLPGAATKDGAVVADSKAVDTGVIVFTNEVTPSTWGFALPTIADALKAGNKIDDTNANYLALRALMIAESATQEFTNNSRQPLLAARSTFLTGRKRRGMARLTHGVG
jgi:hypothetical protein